MTPQYHITWCQPCLGLYLIIFIHFHLTSLPHPHKTPPPICRLHLDPKSNAPTPVVVPLWSALVPYICAPLDSAVVGACKVSLPHFWTASRSGHSAVLPNRWSCCWLQAGVPAVGWAAEHVPPHDGLSSVTFRELSSLLKLRLLPPHNLPPVLTGEEGEACWGVGNRGGRGSPRASHRNDDVHPQQRDPQQLWRSSSTKRSSWQAISRWQSANTQEEAKSCRLL